MKQTLELYDQPEAEWLGEAYLPFTPENIRLMVMRINPDSELRAIIFIERTDHRQPANRLV